jgi:hypothetical protein
MIAYFHGYHQPRIHDARKTSASLTTANILACENDRFYSTTYVYLKSRKHGSFFVSMLNLYSSSLESSLRKLQALSTLCPSLCLDFDRSRS